jgi:hypothetical protein
MARNRCVGFIVVMARISRMGSTGLLARIWFMGANDDLARISGLDCTWNIGCVKIFVNFPYIPIEVRP